MKITKIVVVLIALLIAAPLFAQNAPSDKPASNKQLLMDKIKADKKLVVAENMQLTEAEAKGFWPVYEAYQKDLGILNDRTAATIKSYAEAWNTKTITNEKAKKMTAEMLAIQADEVKLMKSYVPKLDKVLSAVKVARYLQIENKIRAMVKYELAEGIPLVPGK
ncbi:MAG: uncharacterized protein H6Q52_73 [Deltaproteobacteria bacterium]|nr:uncharacterized protein [Deltaproteobacteria bacterium]